MATLRTPAVKQPHTAPTAAELDAARKTLDGLWWTIAALRDVMDDNPAGDALAEADCVNLRAAIDVLDMHYHVTRWPESRAWHYRVDSDTVEPQSIKAGTPVRVVFDITRDAPEAVGTFRSQAGAGADVWYARRDGQVVSTPAAYVRVVEVEV